MKSALAFALIVTVIFTLFLVGVAPAAAEGGPSDKFEGKVISLDAQEGTLVIQDKNGKERRINVSGRMQTGIEVGDTIVVITIGDTATAIIRKIKKEKENSVHDYEDYEGAEVE